ncbi:MAG: AMP-binding protein [Polaromonas sp.]|nr:AMP-binding protein [Polaromonas sp.]
MLSHLPDLSVAGSKLSANDLLRVCRDLAWSEMAAMPGIRYRLGPRLPCSQASKWPDWSSGGLALDSLACMQLATAAAVWCNAQDVGFEDLFLAKRNAQDWAEAMQRARSAGARGFTFSTSGSTGKRQHIRHAHDSLIYEAHSWAQVLRASALPVSRIVTLVPCHHIYGFIWGVLVPKALGVPVIDASHEALPELLAGDLLVGVPDQWQWLAGSGRAGAAPVQGVTSTAPMSGPVHQRLITAEGAALTWLSRLIQIYGSTQTGGIAWRDHPDTPYTLAPGRSRSAGGEVELLLPGGALVPLGLQDEVRWTGTNQFELLGRTDSCVQVGGHNVSPAWVREQLLAYPAVEDASVRLDTAAPLPRLKAFVVLKTPSNRSQQAGLQEWALENLPWYAALSSICYGAELPCNVMGKPSDWPVQNWNLL